MISAVHLCKNFTKTVKAPGVVGSFTALFHPEKEIIRAVNDVSFEIPSGEIFGFIGPNGAGKSTVFKMLTGILAPTSGSCEINGHIPQKDRKNYVREIGVVFGQRTQLWWDLALRETFDVLKEMYKVPDEAFTRRMGFLDEVLDLHDFLTSPVRTLSLGQRMRADIAASLLHSPKVLFLDEPTIGLDVAVKDNIRKAITTINAEQGTTIILTTHDMNDIELLCKRIYIIDKGRSIFDGSIDTLKQRYGRVHEVAFELAQAGDVQLLDYPGQFPGLDLETIFDPETQRVSVRFDASKIAVPDIVQYTLAQAAVSDIAVKDADIEDIIRRFFRREALADE